jgi:hypothetical protein
MSTHRFAAGLSLCIGLCACGDQASTAYQGEPLFSMNGRVELNLTRQNADELQPALAFLGMESELRFLDVSMSGEFPSDFTLDVFDRPPQDAFVLSEVLAALDAPRMAVARFTVLPPDHPDVLWVEEISEGGGCLGPDCDPGNEWSAETTRWCTTRGEEADHCFAETVTCPSVDAADECEMTTAGDPSLRVEEVSLNYLLMYVDAAAPRGSVPAYLAGAREHGLSAGYHLLAVEQQTEAQIAEGELCENDAEHLALERYNTEHGTDITLDELRELEEAELDRLRWQAVADLDCHTNNEVWRYVADPAAERVNIRIGDPANGASAF